MRMRFLECQKCGSIVISAGVCLRCGSKRVEISRSEHEHAPDCVDAHEVYLEEAERYHHAYPDYCRTCRGYGEVLGDAYGLLRMDVPANHRIPGAKRVLCPDCLGVNCCPRCKARLSNRDVRLHYGKTALVRCSSCDWTFADRDAMRTPHRPVCYCPPIGQEVEIPVQSPNADLALAQTRASTLEQALLAIARLVGARDGNGVAKETVARIEALLDIDIQISFVVSALTPFFTLLPREHLLRLYYHGRTQCVAQGIARGVEIPFVSDVTAVEEIAAHVAHMAALLVALEGEQR